MKSCYNLGLVENAVFAADKGVIHDILNLYAEVKTNEAVGLITQCLENMVRKAVPTSKIYIDSGHSAGPKWKLDDVHKRLNKAFLSSDWIYKKLIRRVRASCFSPHRTHMPDRDEMSTEEIAEHFQVQWKIRKLKIDHICMIKYDLVFLLFLLAFV